VVLDVEEVGAAQVRVARRLAGPEPGCVDHALESGPHAVGQVEVDPAMDILEGPGDLGDHHVPGREQGSRMPRLERPALHSNSTSNGTLST
jgi:hypothetical protein